MPQQQRLYFGCDLSARTESAVLALVEFTHVYAEFRNPVTWAMEREFQEPRYDLREVETIAAMPHASIAEQIRSRLLKFARQHESCTLAVDATSSEIPVHELFHHLPPRVAVVPVDMRGGAGGVRGGGDSIHVPQHELLAGFREMLETGKLRIRGQIEDWFLPENEDRAIACALAAWRARQHSEEKPRAAAGAKPSDANRSGWGQVRLL